MESSASQSEVEQRQSFEISALESIYEENFIKQDNTHFKILLFPHNSQSQDALIATVADKCQYVQVELKVEFTPLYPFE
jgi:hypothetical protein